MCSFSAAAAMAATTLPRWTVENTSIERLDSSVPEETLELRVVPEAVVCNIFRQLDERSRQNCAQVCRRFFWWLQTPGFSEMRVWATAHMALANFRISHLVKQTRSELTFRTMNAHIKFGQGAQALACVEDNRKRFQQGTFTRVLSALLEGKIDIEDTVIKEWVDRGFRIRFDGNLSPMIMHLQLALYFRDRDAAFSAAQLQRALVQLRGRGSGGVQGCAYAFDLACQLGNDAMASRIIQGMVAANSRNLWRERAMVEFLQKPEIQALHPPVSALIAACLDQLPEDFLNYDIAPFFNFLSDIHEQQREVEFQKGILHLEKCIEGALAKRKVLLLIDFYRNICAHPPISAALGAESVEQLWLKIIFFDPAQMIEVKLIHMHHLCRQEKHDEARAYFTDLLPFITELEGPSFADFVALINTLPPSEGEEERVLEIVEHHSEYHENGGVQYLIQKARQASTAEEMWEHVERALGIDDVCFTGSEFIEMAQLLQERGFRAASTILIERAARKWGDMKTDDFELVRLQIVRARAPSFEPELEGTRERAILGAIACLPDRRALT